MVPPGQYTTPWSAPVSPPPVSPLHVRKQKGQRFPINTMTENPVAQGGMSPLSPEPKISPLSAASPSDAIFGLNSRFSTRRQSKSRFSMKSALSHGYSRKVPVDPSEFSGLQVDEKPEKALPPLPPPPPPVYQARHSRFSAAQNRQNVRDSDIHPLLRTVPRRTDSVMTKSSSVYSRAIADPKDLVPSKEYVLPVARTIVHQNVAEIRQRRVRRRRCYWLLGAIIVVVVIVSVIVGAIVGTQKRAQREASVASATTTGASPVVTPTAAPTVYNAALPPKALQVDTSLVPVQFTANTSAGGQSSGQQNYGIWYQNKCGNVKGVQYSASWSPYGTAFTDAANVSGMAGINFFNTTIQSWQTYLFYVSVDGKIRDKKLNPKDNTFEIGPLAAMHIGVNAAPASALGPNGDSASAWDSFRLAAVYSEHFPSGAGARLFYHASNATGGYLQELVWSQARDEWTFGTVIGTDALPVSHISAIVDEQNGIARLMYATAGTSASSSPPPRLQEYYMAMAHGAGDGGYWRRGLSYPDLLLHNSSAFALASAGGNDYLYRVTTANSSSPALIIQELTLPAANGSDTATIDVARAETVAAPDWLAQDTGNANATLYAPIAAVGSPGAVSVFWAEGVVDARAGYDRLVTAQRELGKAWPASGSGAPAQQTLPADAQCAAAQV